LPASMDRNNLAQRLHGAREKPRKLQCRRKCGWGERFGHERDMNPPDGRFNQKICQQISLPSLAFSLSRLRELVFSLSRLRELAFSLSRLRERAGVRALPTRTSAAPLKTAAPGG
jgi:hypothetical protein